MLLIFVLSLCSCGAKTQNNTAPSENESSKQTTAMTEDPLETERKELESIGDVEVENGILTVSITMPANLVGDTTQESLDAKKGDKYVSATLNEDGSVTYKMTKKQHSAMMQELKKSMDESFQEMINNEDLNFTEIKPNDTYTVFDISLSKAEVGFVESFSTVTFYTLGGYYNIFAGNKVTDGITVNFYGPDGQLIESGNSSNFGEDSES